MDRGERRLPAGVVFDLDGTLVDTETVADEVLRVSLATLGHDVTDRDLLQVRGRAFAWMTRWLEQRFGVTAERYRAVSRPHWERAMADGIPTFDDAIDLLDDLAERGVALAVCTSSGRGHLDAVLATVPALADRFTATVSADDVIAHKPDPEPYALATRLLGANPAATVAIEDTQIGVTSAIAAGLRVIGRSRIADVDLDRAHLQVDRLDWGAVAAVLTVTIG